MSLPVNTAISSQAVSGGTMYVAATHPQASDVPSALSMAFVPTALSGFRRWLLMTAAKADTGVPLTATATGGACGISRTAGTSLKLVGEATSGDAKTDKAVWEVDLPESYVAGANISVGVQCAVTGAGTLTGASTTMTLAAYQQAADGTETALTVDAAQQMVAAGSTLVFAITGTPLSPGDRIILETVMLVTSASGVNTGAIKSVYFDA